MLDENLPTFRFKSSSDNPLSSILYFTQRGDEPNPEYLFRRPDPALPASRDKYVAALCDAYNPDVVYGEVTVEPDWAQPTLSAAEIRAQAAQNGPQTVTATATIPDSFTIQLYNPDQSVTVRMVQGGWNKTDSWEFELPVQTFKLPSASELDRDPGRGSPADLIPRVMFRWKKDGKLSKDMTCYLCGKNLGGRKSKEPDITVALFKASRESIVTIYEPNLHRVEVEDRKGLELVILFGAEIIKELYISPKPDVFNVSGGAAAAAAAASGSGRRKDSRPSNGTTPPVAMSGALNSGPPPKQTSYSATSAIPVSSSSTSPPTKTGPSSAEVEAETRRLQAMVEREEREREKRERAEQKRIKKMLEEEEKEQRRREAEIAKETDRLRKKYGIEGQALPSEPQPQRPQAQPSGTHNHNPPLPPRTNYPPQFAPPPPHWQQNQGNLVAPALPPRPLSAGPPGGGPGYHAHSGPFHSGMLNSLLHHGGGSGGGNPPPPPHMNNPSAGSGRPGGGRDDWRRRRKSEEERRKVHRKRSMGW